MIEKVGVKQELAPEKGFEAIRHVRNLPRRGPSSWMLLLGVFTTTVGGMYFYKRGERIRRYVDFICSFDV